MTTTHTTVPWIHSASPAYPHGIVCSADGSVEIAVIVERENPIEESANGEFIVRACNSHDDLLEVCQWALNTLRDAVACPDGCPEELEAAMVAAIAKAEGR